MRMASNSPAAFSCAAAAWSTTCARARYCRSAAARTALAWAWVVAPDATAAFTVCSTASYWVEAR